MATRDLAVYVVGISGKCSKDYIGCGKSCLCHQFMHNEYTEESYSTLRQTQFDSCVINQQHTIYWGRKEQIYTWSSNGKKRIDPVSVNFEVFEHTVFYKDGTNSPFHGYNNYEDRIFTPCNNFLNKYAFRSCMDVLNPEENGGKKFLHASDLPVAYLYVVDVSQSCSVFETQMQLMSKLVKSIQKTHCCVVVASKFDTHCKANVKFLETFANSMNVPVIKCSAKYNANVDTAFECLAMKALSLKSMAAEKQDVIRRQAMFTDCYDKDVQQDLIRVNTSPNASRLHSVSTSDKKGHKRGSRLSSTFSKIFSNRKDDKSCKPCITMPTSYLQNNRNSTLGLPKLAYKQAVSSCPDLSKVFPRMVKSKTITHSLGGSGDVLLQPNFKSATEIPLPLLPYEQTNDPLQLEYDDCRSSMPLPLTPLELATSRDSVSTTSSGISIGVETKNHLPLPATTLVDKFTKSGNHNDEQITKRKNDYEEIDFGEELSLSHSDCAVFFRTRQNSRQASLSTTNDEMSNEAFLNEELLSTTSASTTLDEVLTHASTASDEASTWLDEGEDYVISDYEFFKGLRQMQEASTNYLTVQSSHSTKTVSPHICVDHTVKQVYSQQDCQIGLEGNDKSSAQMMKANIYDSIFSEESVADQCITCQQRKTPEPKHLAGMDNFEDYVFMHKATCSSLKNGTYDYIDQLYIEIFKRKKHGIGVPPRNVKRADYKPSTNISVCSNAMKPHVSYVNCSNLRQYGTTMLPPRQLQCHGDDLDATTPVTPPRNVPRPGCYLSGQPAIPTTQLAT